ncbi:hypothetical protein PHYPSEUDO_003454 [Phytophthora pseudosyringae]|uniref:Uncharacterized protein n=1 Tax=Phytophthora pseudosyringae TaxID=221518 RepID=A0A8T1VUM7_9STRA|nr:hypothetical protein PHYPSEUDO_003454 [Phytophthora pseudosyringae]
MSDTAEISTKTETASGGEDGGDDRGVDHGGDTVEFVEVADGGDHEDDHDRGEYDDDVERLDSTDDLRECGGIIYIAITELSVTSL